MPSLRARRFALAAAAAVVPASILLASCTGDDPRIVDGSDGGSSEAAEPSVDAAST